MSYAIVRRSADAIIDAVDARARKALMDQSFGILIEIDAQTPTKMISTSMRLPAAFLAHVIRSRRTSRYEWSRR